MTYQGWLQQISTRSRIVIYFELGYSVYICTYKKELSVEYVEILGIPNRTPYSIWLFLMNGHNGLMDHARFPGCRQCGEASHPTSTSICVLVSFWTSFRSGSLSRSRAREIRASRVVVHFYIYNEKHALGQN